MLGDGARRIDGELLFVGLLIDVRLINVHENDDGEEADHDGENGAAMFR